jgi:tetratricopeptide (TPR) repeat protein
MANKGNGGHFDLLAPTRAELMQMIRLPAVAANLTWSLDVDSATPLDQILCAEAANNPDALPMLQYTLQELYLQRSEADELQVSVYKSLGGIEGAIGKKAEEIYQQLPADHQPQLAVVLSRLVTLSQDGETITSRAARWSELSQVNEIFFVQAMVNSRLFVSHLQNNEPCFSLAHEALLRRWSRASEWITAHKDSLTIKSRLQQLTERWLKEDRSSAYLLPQGKPLEEALSLQNMPVFTLDTDERALLKVSQQKVKTKRWLTRSTISLLCLLTFTAIFMSIKSQQSEAFAQQKRLDAESLLGFMVGEFADKLRSVKRMDLLDGISNKALEYFSQQEDEYDSSGVFSLSDPKLNFKAKFQHAQTLSAMGEVAYSRAKTDEARQAFTSAKVILDKLYKVQPENIGLLKNLGANAFWLGQLAMDIIDFTEAKTFFELYLTHSQVMLDLAPNNLDAKWELSYAYLAVGANHNKLQRQYDAKTAFEAALNIQNEILIMLPKDDISHFYIADTLEWLAETEELLGDLQQAVQTRKKVQSILTNLLAIHSGNGDLLESLAYSYFNQANVLYYLGDYAAANEATLTSIKQFNTLLGQDSSNQGWQEQLNNVRAFNYYLTKKIHSDSLIFPLSFVMFKQLLNRTEAFPYFLITTIKNYQLNGDWELAKNAIDLAKSRLEKLVRQQPKNSILLTALSNIYLTEAKQAMKTHTADDQVINKATANKTKFDACQQAILLLQPVVTGNSSFELLLPYVKAHDCLGKLNTVNNFVNKLENMQIKHYHF